MTLKRSLCQGTNLAVVTANTGRTGTEPLFDSAAVSNGALNYDTTKTMNGTTSSILMTASGSGIRNLRVTTGLSTRTLSSTMTFTCPATGGGSLLVHAVAGTRTVSIGFSSGRVLTVIDAAAATQTVTGINTLTAGADYEITLYTVADSTTATAGTIRFDLRAAGSATVIGTYAPTAGTSNCGIAAFTQFWGISPVTSSTVTAFNTYSLGYDDAATGVVPPWFIASSVGPLGTIAHIGDSTSSQDGNGAVNVPAAYVAAGYWAGDISFYGVGSKTINGVDANGKTTVQNIQDARAALPQEPSVWQIQLGTNSRTATNATTLADVTAVMTEIGSTTPVNWYGISQSTAGGGLDANSVRRNAYIASLAGTTFPNMRFIDLDAYIRNGVHDETNMWFQPPDANFAHMSISGYMLRNGFSASRARNTSSGGLPTTMADFGGEGTLAVIRASDSASFSGSGALAVTAKPTQTGVATLTGSGDLTVTGKPAQAAPAAFTGAGTLSVVGRAALAVLVALSGSGTLAAAGSPSVPTAVGLTGSGTLVAVAGSGGSGVAAFTGSGALGVTTKMAVAVIAALSGSGALVVGVKPGLAVAALFTGSGTLIAASVGPVTIVGYFKGAPFVDILYKGQSLIDSMRN